MSARLLVVSLAITVGATTLASADQDEPVVVVQERGSGTYVVTARFTIAEAPEIAWDVLTDYDNISRFMPDVRTSQVVERQERFVRIEQEAVSRYLFFSKRVHLLLDVEECGEMIRFRDRSHESFVVYDGAWRIIRRGGVTELMYELTAQPAFQVPGFVLRKLLSRDSRVMIDRLRAEISARGRPTKSFRDPGVLGTDRIAFE
jgi:hypothetical protein